MNNIKRKLVQNPYFRVISMLLIIGASIMAIVFSVIKGYDLLFVKNKHFTIKHIEVKSTGYWNDKVSEIEKITNIHHDETNIFSIDLSEVKNKLMDLKGHGFEDVDVYRVLPDKIVFNIEERVPRAVLFNRRSKLLLDDYGIVMNKKYAIDIDKDLPLITGIRITKDSLGRNKSIYGSELTQTFPALDLIKIISMNYPEYSIYLINMKTPNVLMVLMRTPLKRGFIKVLIPYSISVYDSKEKMEILLTKSMQRLSKLVNYLKLQNKSCYEINLTFLNRAVVK